MKPSLTPSHSLLKDRYITEQYKDILSGNYDIQTPGFTLFESLGITQRSDFFSTLTKLASKRGFSLLTPKVRMMKDGEIEQHEVRCKFSHCSFRLCYNKRVYERDSVF